MGTSSLLAYAATWATLTHALPSCSPASFNSVLSSADATILSAVPLANGSTYGEGAADVAYPINPTNLPASCALTVNVTSSASSSFRFGIFLPEQWNGRFLVVGNGGYAGGINWLDMGAGVRYGFAVVSTDTGHNSTSLETAWALDEPELREDFGYRSIHGSTVLGKALTQAYYGQNISFSYYSGASTGGRQGLREAQYDADSFDGLLIGAAAWWTSHLQPWETRLGALNLPVGAPNNIPADLFPNIGAEVIKQCDAVDGVVDGIVSAPGECDFDVQALRCGAVGLNSSSACLQNDQIETLQKIYADYVTAVGNSTTESRFAHPGMELGSESGWSFFLGGSTPTVFGDGYIQDFLLNDASWNWTQYTDDIIWQADAADPGNCTPDDYAAMSAVMERGSKILMFHGMADALVPVRSSNFFFDRVADALGGYDVLAPWLRLFLVPGMEHVSLTAVDAPWYFAQSTAAGNLGTDVFSTPGFEDAEHDALMALMQWVEQDVTPEQIIATTWKNSTDYTSGVLRQRPLCPWPQTASYTGDGDVNTAENWNCSA